MVPTINQQKYPPKNTLDAQHSLLVDIYNSNEQRINTQMKQVQNGMV